MYGSPSPNRTASPFWDVQRPLVLDVQSHRQVAADTSSPQFSGEHATGLGTLQSALSSLKQDPMRGISASPVLRMSGSRTNVRTPKGKSPQSSMNRRSVAELSARRREAINAAFRRINPSGRGWVTTEEAAAGLQHFSSLSAVDQSQVMHALCTSQGSQPGGRISFAAFAIYYQTIGNTIERDRDFENLLREHWGFCDVSDIMDDMKNKFAMVGLAYAFRHILESGGSPALSREQFQAAIGRVGIDYGGKEVQRLFDAFECNALEILRFIQHLTSAPRPPTPIAQAASGEFIGEMTTIEHMLYSDTPSMQLSQAPVSQSGMLKVQPTASMLMQAPMSQSYMLSSQLTAPVQATLHEPKRAPAETGSALQHRDIIPDGHAAPEEDGDEPPMAPKEKDNLHVGHVAPPEDDDNEPPEPPQAPAEKANLGLAGRMPYVVDDEPPKAPLERATRDVSYGSYSPPRPDERDARRPAARYAERPDERDDRRPPMRHAGQPMSPQPAAQPASPQPQSASPQPQRQSASPQPQSASPARRAGGRKRAVTIGINYIGLPCQLAGCINDSDTFITLLTEEFGYDVADIRQLRDDHPQRMPTRKNLTAAMKWLVSGAQDGDHLFLHYSGHGTQVADTDGDELDGKDEALVPCDYQKGGVLSDDELRRILVAPLPKGCRLTVVLDCCHSGSAMDLPFLVQVKDGDLIDVKKVPMNGLLPPSEGDVVMISGCMDDQTSADAGSGLAGNTKPSGAMTTAFKVVITKKPTGTFHEVLEEMRKFLKQQNFEQVPQLSSEKFVDLGACFMPEAQASKVAVQASIPASITPSRPPMRKAVTIGCNYLSLQPGQGRLSGCINDSETIIGILKDTFGFQDNQICRLRDDRANMMPTKKNVLAALAWLTSEAVAGDELFLHYSGHGGQVKDTDGDEATGMDDTLIPCDFQQAGQITDDELHTRIVEPLPKGVRMWVILDCCHSGTALDLPYKVQVGDTGKHVQLSKSKLRPKGGQAEVIMISGCQDTQTSADVSAGSMGVAQAAGAMTTALRNCISPTVSCQDLLLRMRDYLNSNTYAQVPQMSSEQYINLESSFVTYSPKGYGSPSARDIQFAVSPHPQLQPADVAPAIAAPQPAQVGGGVSPTRMDDSVMANRIQNLEQKIMEIRKRSQSPMLTRQQTRLSPMYSTSPMQQASTSSPQLPMGGMSMPMQTAAMGMSQRMGSWTPQPAYTPQHMMYQG
mmetsp:Transcript_130655/g.418992  ORF Transcript_130655/g.418992 Transcript_130655/m.418992 type:complete len:1218 (+) Transcript_130655:92-3745(+)